MTDPLTSEALMRHVHALAREIDPRPTGGPQEAQARFALAMMEILDKREKSQ